MREMVAIAVAQQMLDHYDLRRALPGGCVLFSSAEPCAMCLGGIPWSGIDRLVEYAARDEDARAVGFDEGHKPTDWIAGYARRGIRVTPELMREEGAAVLRSYAAAGGEIYGPSKAGGVERRAPDPSGRMIIRSTSARRISRPSSVLIPRP